jgi:hypothetical protein
VAIPAAGAAGHTTRVGGPDVSVEGLRELARSLGVAADHINTAMAMANKDAAQVVARAAALRAPRGRHQGGGTVVPVYASVRVYATSRKAQVGIGGTATPHGQVLEFGGTIPRRAAKGQRAIQRRQAAYAKRSHRSFANVGITRTTKVEARPYLYPAIAASQDEVMDVYDDSVFRLLRPAFPSGARGPLLPT